MSAQSADIIKSDKGRRVHLRGGEIYSTLHPTLCLGTELWQKLPLHRWDGAIQPIRKVHHYTWSIFN